MIPIVRLNPEHLGQVIDLHHQVIAKMPPETVASETDQFYADHMDACGQIFGGFDGTKLIAYSVLGLPRPLDPNFGTDHELSASELERIAHIDGVGVLAEFRGQAWHRRMIDHRMMVARGVGRTIALSTVAPGNFASLINLLSSGMRIVGLKSKFGGDRFLVRADLDGAEKSGAPDRIDVWCPATDRESCLTLIDQGRQGVAYRVEGQGNVPQIGWI